MQEITVDFDLKDLPDPKKMKEWFGELRDEHLTEAERLMKSWVDNSILQSGVKDTHGKVRRWQKVYRSIGYTAVRADGATTGANSPGAITNYLESGHRGRQPRGKTKRYVPRVNTGRARAFHFYRDIQSTVEAHKEAIGKEIAAELEKRLEETK